MGDNMPASGGRNTMRLLERSPGLYGPGSRIGAVLRTADTSLPERLPFIAYQMHVITVLRHGAAPGTGCPRSGGPRRVCSPARKGRVRHESK